MINLYCGFDARESDGYAVFCHSVISRASKPVSFIPLSSMGLPQGTNTFTLSRFLVPWLMGYQGHAIFADASDMLMLGDVAELDALFDKRKAVQVVKHPDYETRHPRKYVGTEMECANRNYSRKNWASLMVVNCSHPLWSETDPVSLSESKPLPWLQMIGAGEDIGELPPEWNVLVDEGQPSDGAQVLHWTAGIPAFDHYKDTDCADLWRAEREAMLHGR